MTRKTVRGKGVPKRDGSGNGNRDNRGRGGCVPTNKTGKAKNIRNKRKD